MNRFNHLERLISAVSDNPAKAIPIIQEYSRLAIHSNSNSNIHKLDTTIHMIQTIMDHQLTSRSAPFQPQVKQLQNILSTLPIHSPLLHVRRTIHQFQKQNNLPITSKPTQQSLKHQLKCAATQFSLLKDSFTAIASHHSLRCLFFHIALNDAFWIHSYFQHKDFELHKEEFIEMLQSKQIVISEILQSSTDLPIDVIHCHIMPFVDHVI